MAKPRKPVKPTVKAYAPQNVMALRPGWSTQACQFGGLPAIAVYAAGRLQRVTQLMNVNGVPVRRKLPLAAFSGLPKVLGGFATFVAVGQVRDGVFETIALSSKRGRILLGLNRHWQLFDSPSTRRIKLPGATHTVPARHVSEPSPVAVITTEYRKHVTLNWYHRGKGERLYTLVLKRGPQHVQLTAALDTRSSKGPVKSKSAKR